MMMTTMDLLNSSSITSISDMDLMDSYLSFRRRYDLLQGETDVDLNQYSAGIAACQDEYVNRGNTLDALSSDASARVTTLMASDVNDLTDEEVNLRFLYNGLDVGAAKSVALALHNSHGNVAEANEAVGGRKALEAEVNVGSLDDVPKEEAQQGSPVWQFIDQAVMTVGQSWLLSKVGGLFGGSGMMSTLLGVGGRQLLNGIGILPSSIAPVLEMVKPLLPESAQEGIDHVVEALTPKTEEQLEAERFDKYSTTALHDSMETSIMAANDATAESVREAMRVNGEVIGSNGVMANVGTDGFESASSVNEVVVLSTTAATTSFDERIAAGEDCSEDMRYYYMSLFGGLDGYNEGAITGINATYDPESPEYASAVAGLGHVNGQYCDAAIASLREYDSKYHFMTEEDWEKLDGYHFAGVDGPLSAYVPTSERVKAEEAETDEPTDEKADAEQEEPCEKIPKPDQAEKETDQEKSEKTEQTSAKQPSTEGEKVDDVASKREERVQQAEDLEQRVTGGKTDDGPDLKGGMGY